jgi:23S rRNA (adenine2030-N6)-methyltransferase
MNYRHCYHAGNFADVFKHLLIINIIEILLRKEKPFCYLDTHAGGGVYALSSVVEKKPAEHESGIQKIMNGAALELPILVQKYIEVVKAWGYPKYYPGSPAIAKTLLRDTDRLILTELHSEEHHVLKEQFSNIQNMAIHHLNGYQALKAFLPPKERRGFILIDPPFEKPDEWHKIIENVKIGLKKFAGGIYAIWYPIKNLKEVQAFLNAIDAFKLKNVLLVELCVYPKDIPLKLIGNGMLIINPPWPLQEEIKNWLPWVWQVLSVNHGGGYRLQLR